MPTFADRLSPHCVSAASCEFTVPNTSIKFYLYLVLLQQLQVKEIAILAKLHQLSGRHFRVSVKYSLMNTWLSHPLTPRTQVAIP
jgi:hypothetical protein